MARIMIVGGGCRGRRLAREMVAEGHALRISTRSEAGRATIEAVGAECWVGTPDRLATLRGALDRVTIVCWLLGSASGDEDQLQALFGPRLELFLTQAIDTTVRGFVYETQGTAMREGAEQGGAGALPGLLARGERTVRELCQRNAIPAAFLHAAPDDVTGWLTDARSAIDALLAGEGAPVAG